MEAEPGKLGSPWLPWMEAWFAGMGFFLNGYLPEARAASTDPAFRRRLEYPAGYILRNASSTNWVRPGRNRGWEDFRLGLLRMVKEGQGDTAKVCFSSSPIYDKKRAIKNQLFCIRDL